MLIYVETLTLMTKSFKMLVLMFQDFYWTGCLRMFAHKSSLIEMLLKLSDLHNNQLLSRMQED